MTSESNVTSNSRFHRAAMLPNLRLYVDTSSSESGSEGDDDGRSYPAARPVLDADHLVCHNFP